jgi:hypothetical protein
MTNERNLANAETLLKDACKELNNHQFSADGSYNNDDVIDLIERIDAYFRGDEPLKVGGAVEPRAPLRAPETAAEVILGGNWIVGYCASCTPVDGMHQPDCPLLAGMRAALTRQAEPTAKAYGPGMTPHAADCKCHVCDSLMLICPHCGKAEPHTHRVPGVPEPVVFPHK